MNADAGSPGPKEKIVTKAMKDRAFREALLKDATGTIEKELGVKLPGGMTVKVVEDSASQMYLVLPPARSAELSDLELDAVSGGGQGCFDQSTSQRCWDTKWCVVSAGPGG